jgi:site-specific recombinase XerD
MTLLHARIDTASIAPWLGHATIQTTQAYLHADLEQTPHPRTRPRDR